MEKAFPKKAILKPLGSLQDFLSNDKEIVEVTFELHPSVKDTIESQGIPHTAVFKLETNGQDVSFDYNLQDGDEITIHPLETVNSNKLSDIYLEPNQFIADIHLGKLAKTLRLLGFDTLLNKRWDDEEIIRRSNNEHRMILTRDLGLLKDGDTQFGYWVRSTNPERQVEELFNRFSLEDSVDPFTRCMKCNGRLETVAFEEVENHIPPKVKEWHSEFFQCTGCEQVYWEGSHYKKLKKRVKELTNISS